MNYKLKVKASTLSTNILRGIALTGKILIASRNPYFGLRQLRYIIRQHNLTNAKAVKKSIRYLRDRGYVTMTWLPDGKIKVEITKKGEKVIEHISLQDLQIKKLERWDHVWRLVIFDVPNKKSSNRLAFTQNLKNLGFQMVQKSVWVYPYPCHREVMILRKFYGIEEFVIYLETRIVEDGELWRERFNL